MVSTLSSDGRTLSFEGAPPKSTRKHDSRVFGYPSEDGSEILFALSCRCGLSVVDLPTKEEAERHEREHVFPGYERPFEAEVLYTSKGEEVPVSMSDEAAGEILRRLAREADDRGRPNDFLTSLSARFRNKGEWSPGQRPWAHKLANEAKERAERPPEAPTFVEGHAFPRIVEMITKAAESLKYPRIEFGFDEGAIRLSLAGSRSKLPGTVPVTSLGSYESRTFYGRIHRDGRFEPSRRGAPDWVVDALEAFENDPAGTASLQGQRFGSCCFCRRELSTKESLFVGYGPVCADRYGLPWGDVPEEAR